MASRMSSRPPLRSATTGPFTGTYKLMGIVIKSDPRSSYKPSRVIDLLVDGEPRTASFQQRQTQSTFTWEVKPAVIITSKSIISIQPYEARTLIRRRKVETVTIQGDPVFRFCSSRPGDKHDFELACAGFNVLLSVVIQKDTKLRDDWKSRSGRGVGVAASLGENGQEGFFGPPTAPNLFKGALDSLHDFIELPVIPPSLCEMAKETSAILKSNSMPTRDAEADIQKLGEQIKDLLVTIQLPKFSERLTSQIQTVTDILKLVENAALFAEDCSKLDFRELGTTDDRRSILEEFDRQIWVLKRNFSSGKENYGLFPPYHRPEVPTLPVPLLSQSVEEETRSEVSAVELEPDSITVPVDEDQMLLERLDPDYTPTDQINLGCLDTTRGKLLSNITAWLDDASESNVLWLSGAPGTGKTAIAWSLVSELEKQQRFAGEFFVRQHEHSPHQLWLTLAYKMAKFHPAIKAEVYKALTQGEGVDLGDANIAFDKLVAGPLKALDARLSSRRLVFLIDGLEQCGQGYSNSAWQTLLDTLPKWLSLPRHYKLVITSRHQNDIAKVFEGRDIKRMELLTGDDLDNNTQYDVRTYLDYRFAEMRRQDKSISENWPDWEATSKLADHTKGFFTWAAVALHDIQDAAGDRDKLLTTIIEGGTTLKFDKFDQYLEEVFRMAFPRDPPEAFRAIVGIVALSEQPLTMADLGQFLRQRFPSSSEASLEETCYKLLPIISIDKKSGTIRIRHKAYGDYLIDPKRCTLSEGAFFIDRSKVHRKMTISSLKIMQQGLKFNICGLKSSYLMNDQIEDRDYLIETCIPSHLAYACQHWADHLRGIVATEKRDTAVVNLLRNFLNFHLLYWLETLSLIEKSHTASKSLLVAAEWLEPTDKDLSLLAADASRFSLTFAEVIAASAPHIYLSALPFAPASSLISKRYRDQFPRTIKVLQEEGTKWPPMRLSISTDSYVNSVSIHPDGKRVAAAMDFGIAMVVSMTMGEPQFHLSGHGGYIIRTIAYSPSGKRIATGCDDRRLRVYEAENGSLLFGPFEIHADWIRSIAWSPDGQRIVTGSDDRKVKVVVIETGQVLYDTAFHDGWVRTVLYTTEFFISGSDDRTVRIYDVATGTASGEAWTTEQTGFITAIALTPDNKILAAGSEDCTIVLYDMGTRTTINQPIRGHSGPIKSLAFSKDGKLLASGSEDRTVRLWNVPAGQKLCDPLYGHTSCVNSVRFSPDTKQLITGGDDRTVRFFDLDALPIRKNSPGGSGMFRAAIALDDDKTVVASDGSIVSRWCVSEGDVENVPLEGNPEHLVNVQSVSISPDGRLVATAANRVVIIWQADNGTVMWGPLEGHDDTIYALNFSADGKMVVSGSDDRKVWVWSTETGRSVCGPMESHTAGVRGVCFSPDGTQVASGSYDTTAIMWSVESGEKVHEPLIYHRDWVCGVAYSPNGLYLATASDDLSVAIWDVVTGDRVLHVLTGHDRYTRVINWSPDSKKIVSGALDNTIRVFDVETGTLLSGPLTGHKDAPTAVSFRSLLHRDELEIVSSSLDGTVRVWGLRTSFVKTQTFSGNHSDWIHAISFSSVDDSITSGGDDGQLIGMDVVTGSLKFSNSAHKDWIRCVTYSPDGMKVATCSDDHTISIWDAENGERLMEPLEGHTEAVLSIEFSPGGNFLVSGSEDKTVRTWDTHSLFSKLSNPVCTYRGHKGAVNTVAYAHKGELIVSGSAAGEIAVWEGRASDECIRQFIAHSGPVLSICVYGEKVFSSSEDGTIRVWELSTGKALVSILHGHTGPINAIALSPDGRRIVSASDDASLRIFDAETGEACTLPLRMPSRIFTVTVSHDGALVACSGADMSVHVWRANMARRVVWPENFIGRARGLEFCLVDEQGVLADFSLQSDGWLIGRTNKPICWIPSSYRAGLWTPRTVGILGALETILDLRKLVHGAQWEQCKAYVFSDKT